MTPAQRRKRVTSLIRKWRPILFLDEWHINHEFVDEDGEIDESSGNQVSAEIWVNYTYKQANIKTYRGFWKATKDEQDSIIAHELCHCHTQELWDFCTDFQNGKHHTPNEVWRAVETLTQRISVIAKYGGK